MLDIAVLRIAANISSAAACSEFWMISSVIGSFASVISAPSAVKRDVDVAIGVNLHRVAGMDHGGRTAVLDYRRAPERHARAQRLAVIKRGLVPAVRRVVDHAPPLDRVRGVGSVGFLGAHLELADLGFGHEVDTHHLYGSVQPVRVFALVGPVEILGDAREARVGDRALRERHLGGVLLVLVTEPAVAQKTDPLRADSLVGEGRQRFGLRFGEGTLDLVAGALAQFDEMGHETVPAQVRHHHAPGREDAGGGGHHNLPDLQFLGQRHRVHAPPPPKARSVKSRVSKPRFRDTSFSALTMLLLAIRTMPSAAWVRSHAEFPAECPDGSLRRRPCPPVWHRRKSSRG